jgi:hypothetical protein
MMHQSALSRHESETRQRPSRSRGGVSPRREVCGLVVLTSRSDAVDWEAALLDLGLATASRASSGMHRGVSPFPRVSARRRGWPHTMRRRLPRSVRSTRWSRPVRAVFAMRAYCSRLPIGAGLSKCATSSRRRPTKKADQNATDGGQDRRTGRPTPFDAEYGIHTPHRKSDAVSRGAVDAANAARGSPRL